MGENCCCVRSLDRSLVVDDTFNCVALIFFELCDLVEQERIVVVW